MDNACPGIQFLPIDKKFYLKIQSLLRRVELRFPSLRETMFLYRDQLIWLVDQSNEPADSIYGAILGVVYHKWTPIWSIRFSAFTIGRI
jgi:hypothetical protein